MILVDTSFWIGLDASLLSAVLVLDFAPRYCRVVFRLGMMVLEKLPQYKNFPNGAIAKYEPLSVDYIAIYSAPVRISCRIAYSGIDNYFIERRGELALVVPLQ